MSRKPKPKKDRKLTVVAVRMTADQRRDFERAAGKLGIDVSTWMRAVSIREVQRLAVEER